VKVKVTDATDIALTTRMMGTAGAGGGGGGGASSLTEPVTVNGGLSNNSTTVNQLHGVMPCIVGDAAPTHTDTRLIALNCDTDGGLYVKSRDNGASVDYYPGTAAANQDANSIKDSAGVLYAVTCTSIDTTVVYVKLYEDDTPTSAGTVKMKLALSGAASGSVGGGHFNFGPDGIAFATAMGSRYTTGFADNDTNAITSGEVICHFVYR
jgi:hypothetical protein